MSLYQSPNYLRIGGKLMLSLFHVVQVYAYTLAIKTTLLDQLLFILIFPHYMLSILIWKQSFNNNV